MIRKLTGDALALWNFIVPELVAAGIATKLDSVALVEMCESWAELQKIKRSKAGDPYQRDCRAAAKLKAFCWFAARFGLTPSDRTRIEVNLKPEKQSPFAAYRGGA